MTALYRAEGITKIFRPPAGFFRRLTRGLKEEPGVRALTDVDLQVDEGEVVGLVGESGCGKTTLGRIMVGLIPPTAGLLTFRDKPVFVPGAVTLPADALPIQMIFQDPAAALNGRVRVVDAIGEAPVAHGLVERGQRDSYVADLMEKVGLDPTLRFRYPHQFSGGQKQRIVIARALAVKPSFIVCDEAIAALDISIQAQVLNLLMELRRALGLAYLFISHDLGVVKHIADRVAVMYLGRIVEQGPARAVFAAPIHPYTRALAAEAPSLTRRRTKFKPVEGEPPSPLSPPSGCAFHPRCPFAVEQCRREVPPLVMLADGRAAACHRQGEI